MARKIKTPKCAFCGREIPSGKCAKCDGIEFTDGGRMFDKVTGQCLNPESATYQHLSNQPAVWGYPKG